MILRGVLDLKYGNFVEAKFANGVVKTPTFPEGYEFTLNCITFAMDEDTKEIVYSPNATTFVYARSTFTEVEDEDEEMIDPKDVKNKLGVSLFALVDLLEEKRSNDLRDLVDNAIMHRQYTEE